MRKTIRNSMTKIQGWLLIATLLSSLTLSSCSEDTQLPDIGNTQEWQLQTFKLSSLQGSQPEDDLVITSLNAYLFVDGTLQRIYNDIVPQQSNNYNLNVAWNSTLYFAVNLPETSGLKSLTEGVTSLDTFLHLTTETSVQDDATMFYTGLCKVPEYINANQIELNVPLLRSVARFDLDTTFDPQIRVKRIEVAETSIHTTIFPQSAPLSSQEKKEYLLKYDAAIGTTENILQVYESNTPVNVTVYADYLGTSTIVRMSVPQLKRNFKYTIELKGLGANITGTLQVLPWGDGGTIDTLPDGIGQIALQNRNSILPTGVTINQVNRTVSVSEKGGNMTLAFASDKAVELESADGLSGNVTITPASNINDDGVVISKFLVNVAPQGNGRLGYQVVMRMRRSGQQSSSEEFYINVSPSINQIATVTMGGVTWMAFNATTPNLDDQTYTFEGESVEDAYRYRWSETLGGLFQFGRQYRYYPWQSGSHNAGNQAMDFPNWTTESHLPCPPGYRLPTKAEMRSLLPTGVTIPGTYQYNGETITAEVVNAVPLDIKLGNVSGRARYLKLSSSKGTSLIIPMGGQKSDKSPSENPTFGAGFGLWTSETAGAYGGHGWTGFFWPGVYNTHFQLNNSELPLEAFTYVRCLKK